MSKLFKKITILVVTMLMLLNFASFSVATADQASDLPFSSETLEWLEWFNSLSYDEQLTIHYRPYEITQYLDQGNEPFAELIELIEADNYNIQPNALVIAPGKDYHWYRQNPNGSWSHKRGHTAVIKTDASGYIVSNPKICDRNYGSLNYSTFVGFYIVKYQ